MQMVLDMKAGGFKIRFQVKEEEFISMEMSMKDIG